MRSLIAFLLIPLLVIGVPASQLCVSGPNQGMRVQNFVLDLSDSTNWTILMRIRFDPALSDGNHDTFAQTTFNGSQFTCAGVFLRAVKSGSSFPLSVKVTLTGGISSSNILTGGTNMTLGHWHTTVITHDSSHNWTIYLDGVSDGTTNSSVTTTGGCNTDIATVEGATDCGSPGLGGDVGCWINDVALYSSVLPLNDIKAFNSGTRPNQLSVKPLGWWPMDAGRPALCGGPLGPNAPEPDMSGNGHTVGAFNDPVGDYCQIGAATNSYVGRDTGEATH